ncbi:MAG: hydrogenase accessory protein HypB [Spirochaetes bacterium]|nr:MAG: hydrogenase accessory protein HypB [Spirochaetota bacterium]HDO82477.1 hydrogenase accessory protein HypB [Candidatus Altiarchaeales archaeon]HEX55126.1 hydrogenase accessory protein HypB [Candidatus Altiarchaeales archaeon]
MHVIGVDRDIFEINREIARKNRKLFERHNVLAINIMGAIGSGKTSLIEIMHKKLGEFKIAAIAGDVVSDIDSKRLKRLTIPVQGVNTGKECHLDAHLVSHALERIPLRETDILFIENVGNLICPADFDLGAQKNITIVSVSEGDDTIEKHPMIFLNSDALIINKIDIANAVNASVEKMEDDAKKINSNLRIFKTSMKTGDGIPELVEWIKEIKNE